MKKTLGIIAVISVLASFTACSNKREAAQTSVETTAPAIEYADDSYDEDSFAYYDLVDMDLSEAVSGCFSVVSARCDGLVSDSEELREYEFTLEKCDMR